MGSDMTLYIEIFQPFAQYRNPFTFYYAQSYPLPPKSTIIGMLQNATNMWYGWGEINGKEIEPDDWWELKISVHGGFESYFWNYQQLIKGYPYLVKIGNKVELWNQDRPLYNEGFKAQRTPVYQQELFNGHLFIFIRGDEELLSEIKNALDKPQKILYLGRSEDVIFIRHVDFVNPEKMFKNVSGDVRLTYPTYLIKKIKRDDDKEQYFPIKNQKYPVYSIPIKVLFKNEGCKVRHKAEITKETERDVDFETVIYTGADYSIILRAPLEKVEYFKVNKREFLIIENFGWL